MSHHRKAPALVLSWLLLSGACGPGLERDPAAPAGDPGNAGSGDAASTDLVAPDPDVSADAGVEASGSDGGSSAIPVLSAAPCGVQGVGGVRAIAAARDQPLAVVGFGSGGTTVFGTEDASLRPALAPHAGPVSAVALSATGLLAATGSEAGQVTISSTSDGQTLHSWKAHDYAVGNLAFSPDGATLLTASSPTLKHWRVSDGALLWSKSEGVHRFVRFLADGQTMASGDVLISFRKVADGSRVREVSVQDGGRITDLSPDGTLLAGSWREPVRGVELGIGLWNASDGSKRLALGLSRLADSDQVILSPDGTTIAYRSEGGPVQIFRVSDGAEQGRSNPTAAAIAFAHGATLVSGGYAGTVRMLGVPGGAEKALLPAPPGHPGAVLQVAVSPDGTLFASSSPAELDLGGASSSGDGDLKVWRVSDGALVFTLRVGGTRARRSFAFAPDSASIAVLAPEGRIRVLRTSDWGEIRAVGQDVRSVGFAPDGLTVVGGSYARYGRRGLRSWRVSDGVEELGLTGDGMEPLAFAISPDGSSVAVRTATTPFSESAVSLWRVSDGGRVWSQSLDWPLLGAPPSLAFSPDGKQVALADISNGSRPRLQILDVQDGRVVKELTGEGDRVGEGVVAFSADGRWLGWALGQELGGLHLVRTSDWTFLGRLPGFHSTVAFSPAGALLVTGGADRIVRSFCGLLDAEPVSGLPQRPGVLPSFATN